MSNWIGYLKKVGNKYLFSNRENATHFYANGHRTEINVKRVTSELIKQNKRHDSNIKYQAKRLGINDKVEPIEIQEIEPILPELKGAEGTIDADELFSGMSLKDFFLLSKKLDKEMENENSRDTITGLKKKDEKYFRKHTLDDDTELSRIRKLFDEANKVIMQVKQDTDDKLGNYFSFFKTTTREALERRVNAAMDVLGIEKIEDIDTYKMSKREKTYRVMEYINSEAVQYQNDFVDAFLNHVHGSDRAKLKKAVYSLTPRAFMTLLKQLNQDSLAYSLDSTIEDFGYELVLGHLNLIVSRIRKLHEKKGTNVTIENIDQLI